VYCFVVAISRLTDCFHRTYLKDAYGFHCTCSVCSLPSRSSRMSDERLSKMTALHQELSEWASGRMTGEDAIAIINDIWRIGEQEGYWSERGRLAADGVWVAAAHSE
jgi:hypothetical protein